MNELPINPNLQSLRELSEINRIRDDPYMRQKQKEDSFERRAQRKLASLDKQMERELSFERRAKQRLDSLNRNSIPITYRDDELFNTPVLDDIEDDKLFKTPRSLSRQSSINEELFESPRPLTLSDKFSENYDWENPIEIKVRLNEKLQKCLILMKIK